MQNIIDLLEMLKDPYFGIKENLGLASGAKLYISLIEKLKILPQIMQLEENLIFYFIEVLTSAKRDLSYAHPHEYAIHVLLFTLKSKNSKLLNYALELCEEHKISLYYLVNI